MGGVLSVCQVHDETVRLEQELRAVLPVLARVTVHVDCAEDLRAGRHDGLAEQGGAGEPASQA